MATSSTQKFVYFFGDGKAEGKGDMKSLLGGKGAGLAEMTLLKLPVPAGFTITTEVCSEYYKNGQKYSKAVEQAVEENLKKLEKVTGKILGDPEDPLLVSVRSGAAISMPGMMETILNLGLTDESVEGLAKKTDNRRFALDAYRRFIMMYGSIAMEIPREEFDKIFESVREKQTRNRLGREAGKKVNDSEIDESELEHIINRFKQLYKKHIGKEFPQDPRQQLWGAISAVFGSWMADKAVTYRKVENITGLAGTAVNVMQMVFGNKGESSGTGVAFTREPNSGKNDFYGDYLVNAQGEDVVAGIRTPMSLTEFAKKDKKSYEELLRIRGILEDHYRDMQDMEFTVEEGKLYMLQCRTGKRLPAAAFKMAVDMVKEGLISKETAVSRIKATDIEGVFYDTLDKKNSELKKAYWFSGIPAVPGAACGKICLSPDMVRETVAKKERAILVRHETSPEDVAGMHAASGILTASGGKTSHAAVVARGWGKCCIVGAETLVINYEKKECHNGDVVLHEGDYITLDGNTGEVYQGEFPLVKPKLGEDYKTLMTWVDEIRTIKTFANADNPLDAKNARSLGAEGIGLCRTEHMFFNNAQGKADPKRILALRQMIIAKDTAGREKALKQILPMQTRDFEGIFKAMDGCPVTIRLIDPPLHEFLPHTEEGQKALADDLDLAFGEVSERVNQLAESNPMLGHRGCRLLVTYPEILEMQVKAIISSACNVQKKGIKVFPEIMIPLVIDGKEFAMLEQQVRAVAERTMKEKEVKVKYLVGTMIETPRAALQAGKIAEHAEFFSFGTNDLTQMTLGLSRDDATKFLPEYVDETKAGVFKADPFQSLDQIGVGELVKMGIMRGRETNPKLHIGVCGEHGGDLNSVKFFCKAGVDYVSASPYRVPISRLAAAQAVVESKTANNSTSTTKKSTTRKTSKK